MLRASGQSIRIPWEPLALGAMVVVFFGGVLFADRIFLLSDLCFLFYPGYVFFRDHIWQGSLPLWNPYTGCGEPFLADLQRGVFYPPNVIYLLLPTSRAIVVTAVLHIVVAGLGTYTLSRALRISRTGALLAGLIYALNSYTLTKIEFPSQLGSLSWLPFVLTAFVHWLRRRSRGSLFLLAGAMCLQFLAGHPETQVYGLAALAFYAVFVGGTELLARRGWRRALAPSLGLFGAGLLAMLLSTAQLLPTVEALRLSVRAGPTDQLLNEWSIHPLAIFTLLIPSLYGTHDSPGGYWAPACHTYSAGTFYVGIVPIVIFLTVGIHRAVRRGVRTEPAVWADSCVAPRVPYFITVAAFFFAYSLAEYAPLHRFLLYAIPWLNRFEGPAKSLPCVVLSLSCLSGIGMDWLARSADEGLEPKGPWLGVVLRWGAFLCFVAIGLSIAKCLLDGGELGKTILRRYFNLGARESVFPHHMPWDRLLQDSIKVSVVGLLSALLVQQYLFRRRRRSGAAWLITFVAFGDLWLTNSYVLHPGPAAMLKVRPKLLDDLRPPRKLVRYLAFEDPFRQQTVPEGIGRRVLNGIEVRQSKVGFRQTVYPLVPHCLYLAWPLVHKAFNVYSSHNFLSRDVDRVLQLAMMPAVPMPARQRVLAMFNCDRILMLPDIWHLLASGDLDPPHLISLPEPMPRAYVVGGVKIVSDSEGIQVALALGDSHLFDPWSVALIDQAGTRGNSFADLRLGRVDHRIQHLEYGPNRLRVDVDSMAPGMLVVSDTYYPGWRATVNGQEAPIYKVNGAVRGVVIPAGSSEVTMDYNPMSVRIGVVISMVTLCTMVILLLPRPDIRPFRKARLPDRPRSDPSFDQTGLSQFLNDPAGSSCAAQPLPAGQSQNAKPRAVVPCCSILIAGSLMTSSAMSEELPDLSSVRPDLKTPSMTVGEPAPGKRVRQALPEYDGTEVYHVLYLPTDWRPGRRYPVIVEYAGNGPYRSKYGDVCTGRPEDCNLGYGVSGGRGFIWVCLPYIDATRKTIQRQWWGDVAATVSYCKEVVPRICEAYGGDLSAVILTGFSRGAIACNYIGLHDDEVATLWAAFITHSNYDGVHEWDYPASDRASALERLKRLKGRPTFVSQERSVENIRRYLVSTGVRDNFTFQTLPYRNHRDDWVLRDIPERRALRNWLREVLASRSH